MTRAKRYWTAVPKPVYDENVETPNGKVYYTFHGGELTMADSVGDVVRELVEREADHTWMVIKYVPVPSSMHQACWAALHGDDPSLCAFKVRVHEKFEFPQLSRGAELADAGARVPADLGDDGPEAELEAQDAMRASRVDLTRQRAADAVRDVANNLADDARIQFCDDERMRAVMEADAADLCGLADEIESGDDAEAARLAGSLDTAVRERIPAEAWPYCGLRPLHG